VRTKFINLEKGIVKNTMNVNGEFRRWHRAGETRLNEKKKGLRKNWGGGEKKIKEGRKTTPRLKVNNGSGGRGKKNGWDRFTKKNAEQKGRRG